MTNIVVTALIAFLSLTILGISIYAVYISHITRKAEEEYFPMPEYDGQDNPLRDLPENER